MAAAHPILVFLNAKKEKLVAAVPRTFQAALTWESIVQGVAIALEDPKNGHKLGACRPETVYHSLITILRLGLDPAPVRQQAFLVPRKGECTALIGAQGKIELAYRSGQITKIVVQCVYADDDIEIDLATGDVVHRITREQLMSDRDPGPPIAAYARIWIRGTDQPITELMRRRDLLKIKRIAASGGDTPAWKNWEEEMFRRSVLNRALKRAPKSIELMEVLNREVSLEEHEPSLVDVIDAEPPAEVRALPEHIDAQVEDVEAELAKLKSKEPVSTRKPADTDLPFNGEDMP